MHSPRWWKALRDLWLNKARTALVILAMTIGVFGIGMVVDANAILQREMGKNYFRTTPASATITVASLDDAAVQAVRALPSIAEAEARLTLMGRIQIRPDEWRPIMLFVVRDFNDLRLDTFTPEKGTWPPARDEILLERVALSLAGAEVGDTLEIRIPGGETRALKLGGTVHAPGLAPAWMEGMAYGFITVDTLTDLGGKPELNELKILVAENPLDQAAIRATTLELKSRLEQNGLSVVRIEIPKPGQHPHFTQMATLLFLLEAFGLMALILSGVLVANMISALLAQQIREIGVMKAVGAETTQIAGLYLGMVLGLGLVALLIGMPMALVGGRAYAAFSGTMLNFVIFDDAVPFEVYALQAAVGLLMPLGVALYPILRGSRITVREALSDYGVNSNAFGRSPFDEWLSRAQGFSRPFLLSLRNTFRQRARLLLTLGTLATGGAVFIVAMNVGASMDNTVISKFDVTRYDLQIQFNRNYSAMEVQSALAALPGVTQVESWGGARAALVYEDKTTGNTFNIVAPPSSTRLFAALPLVSGRWLAPGEEKAVVINQMLWSREPGVEVGDFIRLRIEGQESTWQVVGIAQEMMALPTAYVNGESLSAVMQGDGLARNAVVVAAERDPQSVALLAQAVESRLAKGGFDVGTLVQLADLRESIENHLLIIASLLVVMSFLVVVVGGLGLMSTMSINVLERRREIGVLRAIGASTHDVVRILVAEGALIGLSSWILALVLSYPISIYLSYNFGMIFFEAPLRFAVSVGGMGIWLVLAMGFGALASFYPAWTISQRPVREVLAYE